MFIVRKDDEHEEAVHRRANHFDFEGSGGRPFGQRALSEAQTSAMPRFTHGARNWVV